MKGMLVSIYRNAEIRDCTNGGISSRVNKAVLTGDGIPGIFEPHPDAPELKLIYRPNIDYYHAEPVEGKNPKLVGWMAGGNYCFTSDSRLTAINHYPIPIHDRQETQADYNSNFD